MLAMERSMADYLCVKTSGQLLYFQPNYHIDHTLSVSLQILPARH